MSENWKIKPAYLMLIGKLSKLSGWYRAGVVLTVLWLIASAPIYLSNVGLTWDTSSELPSWMPLWRQVFLFSKDLPLFGRHCHERLPMDMNLSYWDFCSNEQSDEYSGEREQ